MSGSWGLAIAASYPAGPLSRHLEAHATMSTSKIKLNLNLKVPTTSVQQAKRPFFVGVDAGGTNIKFGVVDDNGSTLAQDSIPTHGERTAEDAVARMAHKIPEILGSAGIESSEVAAVGLATPGTMDIPNGLILAPPNIPGWRHFPIRDALQKATGIPVSYTNDANAAGFGEFWVGCGKEFSSIVLLTLGTGVGAGIVLQGRTIDGKHSHGAECGHVPIEIGPQARICGCGQPGHLEAYASATALVKRTTQLLSQGRESSLSARLQKGEPLTTRLLFEEAEAGDVLANEAILEAGSYLAVGIITVVHTIDPAAVVLGGAMDFGGHDAATGRKFLEHVRAEFRRQTFVTLAESTVIDFAQLGGDAGYIGAAGIAREAHAGRNPALA